MNVIKNLCIVLTDKGREKIKEEREKKFGSQEDASSDTGIVQINISRWERGVYNPKFYAFRSYLQKLGIYDGFLKNKKYVSGTKYHGFKIKKIKSNKMSKELAYVLGVVGPGDGYINREYTIGLDVCDKDFADYFQSCLEKVFDLKCKRYIKLKLPTKLVKSSSKQYSVQLHSKSAVQSLKKYKVSFKEGVWRIPKKIKDSDDNYKSMYLKGIYDSQASVNTKAKSIVVGIKNSEGIKEIYSLLKNIGIESSIYQDEIRLIISSQKYLQLYNSKIGFIINRKQKDLNSIQNSYRYKSSSHKDIKRLLPEMTRLRKNGLSYRKISALIGIGRGAIGNHLKRENFYGSL